MNRFVSKGIYRICSAAQCLSFQILKQNVKTIIEAGTHELLDELDDDQRHEKADLQKVSAIVFDIFCFHKTKSKSR